MSYDISCITGYRKAISSTQVNDQHQQSRSSDPGELQQSIDPEYRTAQQHNYSSSYQSGYSTLLATQPQTDPQQPPSPESQHVVSGKQEQAGSPMQEESTPEFKPTATEIGVGAQSKSFWKNKTSPRLPKKIRKQRQNARLRRILNPKNAIAFLNELRPGVKFVANQKPRCGYVASVGIDGKVFSGHSMSILKSKMLASEVAVKHLLLEKLLTADPTTAALPEDLKKEEPKEDFEDKTEGQEYKDKEGQPRAKRVKAEDEFPWCSLCAFALHKLFIEWQKEGAEIGHGFSQHEYNEVCTLPMGGVPSFSILDLKKIPEDANKMHPVMLLNQLHSNCIIYNESREGKPPHDVLFIITIILNGKKYVGKGKTKKEAKMIAAKAALLPLGIKYDDDDA